MKGKHFRSIIASLTIGGFILGASSVMAFASAPAQSGANTKASTGQNSNNQSPRRFGRNFDIKPVLDKLVKAKTITAAQETKLIAYENKQNAARQAEMQKFQKMTDAQRQAYMQKQRQQYQSQKPGQNQNRFADLVKNKTITQKQADAINKAIAAARPQRGNWQGNGNGNGNGQNPPNN